MLSSAIAQRILTLEQAIALASDSALEAFKNKNLYLSGYWEFRSFKANRLPSVTLNLMPANYNRGFVSRYDSEEDIEFYGLQRFYAANGGLLIEQNLDLLGGTFFIESGLQYLRYMGDHAFNQFSAVPISIGYKQDLIGYNPFRWEKKIEPLKYEKVKKELLYNIEGISEQATNYFFELAMAQVEYDMARENVANSDTLYRIGQERHKIAAISRADLLTLRLDATNARNTLQNADIALKRAMFSLSSFLNMEKGTNIRLRLPSRPRELDIQVDQALSLARENNPDYLAMRQQVLEAEQEVDKTRKESWFNASLNASVGFNQVASNFRDVYKDPSRQDLVSISISIPLVDWGVRKGKHNIAKSNLNIAQISSRQQEVSLEEEVIITVSDFQVQQQLIISAEEALDIASMAYDETKQRFVIGKADISSLTLAWNRQQEAQRNYVTALQNYWLSYYKIRKLTLFDFETGLSLSNEFDYEHGL